MPDEGAPKNIDWAALAQSLGTLHEGGESGGSNVARKALELIIGESEIRAAVDYYVSQNIGAELTRHVLWQIRPWSAMQRCCEIYEHSDDIDERRSAIELLRVVADGRAVPWVEQFLDDPDDGIQNWGAGVVDQLLWSDSVDPEDCKHLLDRMAAHPNSSVRDTYDFISKYLKSREESA
jgi:hypothetical protein